MTEGPPPQPRRRRTRRPVPPAATEPPAGPDREAVAPEPVAEPEPVAAAAAAQPTPEPAGPEARARSREDAGSGLHEQLWRSGILNVGAIARRELSAFFVSPVGYVIGAIVAALVAWSGYLPYLSAQQPVAMDQVYYWTIFWMMIGVPVFTMRLLAEERRMGTLELLLTSPVRDWEVVLGKWLGALGFFVVITAFVFVIAGLLIYFQPTHQVISVAGLPVSIGNLDLGPVLTGYLGLLLTGGAFLAIGLLCSSLTSNQIVAAFSAMAALAVLFFLLSFFIGRPPYGDIVNYLWAYNHWTSFSQGRLVVPDVVYYLSLIVGALFLSTRVLESRRWR